MINLDNITHQHITDDHSIQNYENGENVLVRKETPAFESESNDGNLPTLNVDESDVIRTVIVKTS